MSSNGVVCFLTGLGLGAILGMIYAPYSGEDTRGFLLSKSDEGKKVVNDAAEHVMQKAEDMKKTVRDRVEAVTAPI